jgi:hypothetical protein
VQATSTEQVSSSTATTIAFSQRRHHRWPVTTMTCNGDTMQRCAQLLCARQVITSIASTRRRASADRDRAIAVEELLPVFPEPLREVVLPVLGRTPVLDTV